jgi:hypothetical protein
VIQRDQSECDEAPEYKGVREAGQRAFPDNQALAEHLPEKTPDARPNRLERIARIFLSLTERCYEDGKPPPEQCEGDQNAGGKQNGFN